MELMPILLIASITAANRTETTTDRSPHRHGTRLRDAEVSRLAAMPQKASSDMGRELKRVPMDFDSPLNEAWEGYVNPHYRDCPDCEHGATKSGEALEHLVHLILVAGSDSLRGMVHPWIVDAGVSDVGDTMYELTSGLSERPCHRPLGHDAIDRWTATKNIIKAAGLPEDWATCKTCNGDAIHPEAREAVESWEKQEPPSGDGYQLWETTSEGSPVSPVFETLDKLCEWCESNATTFADNKVTSGEWKSMLSDGLVCHKEGNRVFI